MTAVLQGFWLIGAVVAVGWLLAHTRLFGVTEQRMLARLTFWVGSPALLFLVLGVSVVTLLIDPLGDRDELGKTVLVALTWTGNLPFGHASDATSTCGPWRPRSSSTWSGPPSSSCWAGLL